MKRNVLFAAVMLAAGSLLAADAKDEVTAAAKKLADSSNYAWKVTTEPAPGGGGGGGGGGGRRGGGFGGGAPSEGMTEKGGYTVLTYVMGDNKSQAVVKGEKGAIQGQDGWQSLAELAAAGAGGGGGGGGRRGGGRALALRNFKAPAAEAEALVAKVKDIKMTDGAYVGDLTEEGAKSLMFPGFGRGGGGGGNGPEIADAKGTAKFWVKDGVIAKYEFNVKGKISFNGNDRDIDRTTTVEIKDVGKTKVEVPEDAKKKMSEA